MEDLLAENHLSPYNLGKSGEAASVLYLERKKYKIVERGFRLHRGEIDIIAYDKETLVFIEVKTRRGKEFGPPEESITPAKQKQIRKIAESYLAFHNLEETECRFDVLSLTKKKKNTYTIHHIKDAF